MKGGVLRAFVAIDTPEEVRGELGYLQNLFRMALSQQYGQNGSLRWTSADGLHLTLKFLGEVAEEQVQPVIDRLEEIQPFGKFEVAVKRFGFFPNPREPRVFWAGIDAPRALQELARSVDESLAKMGFEREKRPYTPHLTLARFKAPKPIPVVNAMIQLQQDREVGRFEVSEFFLFESRLSPSAPAEYRKIARFPAP